MSTASFSFIAAVGFIQGFIQWPLIVSCVRWLFRWFEEASKGQKLPEWFYGIIAIFGLLFAEVVEVAIAMSITGVTTGGDRELYRQAARYWVIAHLIGIFIQIIFLAVASRLKPKK
jgi:hypothetical protein